MSSAVLPPTTAALKEKQDDRLRVDWDEIPVTRSKSDDFRPHQRRSEDSNRPEHRDDSFLANIQRSLVYGNWLRPFWYDLNDPCEVGKWRAGSARNVSITTADDVRISAWHIIPVEHQACETDADFDASLSGKTPPPSTPVSATTAAPPLPSRTKLWIYFHGSSWDRGFPLRIAAIEMIKKVAPDAHILVVEYRGFGDSEKVIPTERGLQEDALAAWEWALSKGVPPSRVVIFGHSLGTGPASFLYRHLHKPIATDPRQRPQSSSPPLPGSLLLFCPYSSIASAVATHPLSFISPLHKIVGRERLRDKNKEWVSEGWDTETEMHRLKEYAAATLDGQAGPEPSNRLDILIVHGIRDSDIPLANALEIFISLAGKPADSRVKEPPPPPLSARDGSLYVVEVGEPGSSSGLKGRLFTPELGTHTNLPNVEAVTRIVAAWVKRSI